jgi:hypothetical protein
MGPAAALAAPEQLSPDLKPSQFDVVMEEEDRVCWTIFSTQCLAMSPLKLSPLPGTQQIELCCAVPGSTCEILGSDRKTKNCKNHFKMHNCSIAFAHVDIMMVLRDRAAN